MKKKLLFLNIVILVLASLIGKAYSTANFEPDEFKVETSFGSTSLIPNQIITANTVVENVSKIPYDSTKNVLAIVALYDNNNSMINVSYISKGIEYKGKESLSAGFKLPASNLTGYSVKSFLWDGIDIKSSNMLPISNVVQIPQGTSVSIITTPTPSVLVAKAIAAGQEHSVALKEDGTIVTWGSKVSWDGETAIPEGINNVKAIAAGPNDVVVLKEDGTVKSSNMNYGIPPNLSNIKAIAEGDDEIVTLDTMGKVSVWKYGSGLLSIPENVTNVKAVAAGVTHTVVLKEDGTVFAWGNDSYGKCKVPQGLTDVKAIAAGENHTVALKENGTVIAWGNNSFSQCDVPPGLSNVKAIAASYNYTMALKEDGTVIVWGTNTMHQCDVPAGLSNVKAIAAGGWHLLALKEDGTVVAWGYNGHGQCNVPNTGI